MEYRLYFRMMLAGWWIIALTALSALAIALAAAYAATPRYTASARFIVSPSAALQGGNEILYSLETLDRRSIVVTYSEVLNSQRLFSETGAALKLSAEDLQRYSYRAVVLPDANIVVLSITGPDPQIAMQLTNSAGDHAIAYVSRVYMKSYDLSVLDPATLPVQPISPQPVRDAGLALTLGLVLGAALAILREHLRTPPARLRQEAQLDSDSSTYTRPSFQHYLSAEVLQRQQQVFSLALLYLDGLQNVIETQPHATVQRLLHQVTQILRNELRENDIIGRWDDTSFALLLPAASGVTAIHTLERIEYALLVSLVLAQDGETFRLQPFTGIAVRQHGEPADILIEQAEAALAYARQTDTQVIKFADDMPALLHTDSIRV